MEQYVIDLIKTLKSVDLSVLDKIINRIVNAETIYVMGNGGSAATAAHFACDLVNSCGLRAVSLTDNISIISATANDQDYCHVFTRTLRNFLKLKDLIIIFSCSGESKNVILVPFIAKNLNVPVIAFTGKKPNSLQRIVDLSINVDGKNIESIEDVHLILCHLIARKIRKV